MMDFQEKLEKLPADVISFFTSNDVLLNVEQACFLYGISERDIEKISKQIGMIFVRDERLINLQKIITQAFGVDEKTGFGIAWEMNKRIFAKFPQYFKDSTALLDEWGRMKSIPVLSENEAWKKVLEAEPWIAELENEKEEEAQAVEEREEPRVAALVQITLQEALKKYPRLGEQALSGSPIKLKVMPDLVRPSIKNWISDYYEKIEARKHDSIERGNYLFHSENPRRLTTGDRQKVGMILRALDEDSLITVDPNRQEVVFENGISEAPKSDGTSFSSPHKFPSELKRPDSGLPMGRQNQGPSSNIVNLRNV